MESHLSDRNFYDKIKVLDSHIPRIRVPTCTDTCPDFRYLRKVRIQTSMASISKISCKKLIYKKCVVFLSSDEPIHQLESVWLIANLACLDDDAVHELVSAGAVPLLVHRMYSEFNQIAHVSARALSNIAAGSDTFRDIVLKENVGTALHEFYARGRVTLDCLEIFIALCVNCCLTDRRPANVNDLSNIYPVLLDILRTTNMIAEGSFERLIRPVCSALAHAIYRPYDINSSYLAVSCVTKAHGIDVILKYLSHDDDFIRKTMIRCMNIITRKTTVEQDVEILKELQDCLPTLFRDKIGEVVLDAAQIMTCMTQNKSLITYFLTNKEIMDAIADILDVGTEDLIQRELSQVIKQMFQNGSEAHHVFMLELPVFTKFCELLENSYDQLVTDAVFTSLHEIYESAINNQRILEVLKKIDLVSNLRRIQRVCVATSIYKYLDQIIEKLSSL